MIEVAQQTCNTRAKTLSWIQPQVHFTGPKFGLQHKRFRPKFAANKLEVDYFKPTAQCKIPCDVKSLQKLSSCGLLFLRANSRYEEHSSSDSSNQRASKRTKFKVETKSDWIKEVNQMFQSCKPSRISLQTPNTQFRLQILHYDYFQISAVVFLRANPSADQDLYLMQDREIACHIVHHTR